MAELERALEDCLARLDRGESIDACLERYPEQAKELRPLLLAAARVEELQSLRPSPTFRSQGRQRLQAHMRSRPRRPAEPLGLAALLQNWWSRLRSSLRSYDRRLAYSLATVAVILLTAFTAVAQTALPGQPLYGWKLASESVWRAFRGDKMAADLALLDRRAAELVEVAGDPPALLRARNAYHETLERALAGADPGQRAELAVALRDHWRDFSALGVTIPLLEELLAGQGLLPAPPVPLPTATPSPAGTPLPVEATSTPTPSTPLLNVTLTVDLDLPLGTATETGQPAATPTPEATSTLPSLLPTPSEEIVPTLPPPPLPTATPPDLLPTATLPDLLPTATSADLLPTATPPDLLPTVTLADPLLTPPLDPLPSPTPLLGLPSP